MQILFLDESGTPKPNKESDYFVLAGVSISEDHWYKMAEELKRLKKKYNIIGEIKWRYFAPKKEGAKPHSLSHLSAQEKEVVRLSMYDIITKYESNKIMAVVVKFDNNGEKSTPNDIYKEAYKPITERFQYYLQDISRSVGSKINGIIVCDNRIPKSDSELREHHQNLVDANSKRHSAYKNIVEGLFIAYSHLSVGVQFADMVAGAIYRAETNNDKRYFDLIKNSIRTDKYGNIEKYGIVRIKKDAV